jgi:hypothetical protein
MLGREFSMSTVGSRYSNKTTGAKITEPKFRFGRHKNYTTLSNIESILPSVKKDLIFSSASRSDFKQSENLK